MELNFIGKVIKQNSAMMVIPKVLMQLMELQYGDQLDINFDFENKSMVVKKKND